MNMPDLQFNRIEDLAETKEVFVSVSSFHGGVENGSD